MAFLRFHRQRQLRSVRRIATWVATPCVAAALLLIPAASAMTGSWNQLAPTGMAPAARYSAGNAFDASTDRLILFSGEDFTGLPRPTDVWVLTGATGATGTPSWIELSPTGGPPLGREGGTTMYDPVGNRLIVHGGCSANCSPALDDTWVLTNANGLGGTQQWSSAASSGVVRAEHSVAFDPGSGRMIIFGGHQGFFGTERNDVMVFNIVANSWSALSPTGGPPPVRRAAGIAYDQANNRLILFGGLDAPSSSSFTSFNDVWVLTNANGLGGTPQWTQLAPTGTPPTARVAHTAHYDPSTNRLIVFGGVAVDPSGSSSTAFNDVWVLENANGLGGTPNWTQVVTSGGPPDVRGSVSSGFAPSSGRIAVAMGRGGSSGNALFNDAWVLDLTVSVGVDIMPGSSTNPVNVSKKGVIPVAVLGSSTLDASTVNNSTVCFGDADNAGQRDCTLAANPVLKDVNGDLRLDRLMHFDTQQTGIDRGDVQACLTGRLLDGTLIDGCDSIKTK